MFRRQPFELEGRETQIAFGTTVYAPNLFSHLGLYRVYYRAPLHEDDVELTKTIRADAALRHFGRWLCGKTR